MHIVVKGDYELGDVVRVRVNSVTCFHLKGEEVRKVKI